MATFMNSISVVTLLFLLMGVGYFLYDCYPQQFIDEELTKNNRNKRVQQWKAFTDYLDSKGKLKK